MDESMTFLRWAIPPIAIAVVGGVGILWRRLVQVEDRHVELLREYQELLREMHETLGKVAERLRARSNGSSDSGST